jgi:hypothetical protein
MREVNEVLIDLSLNNGLENIQLNCVYKREKAYSIYLLQLIKETELPILLSFEHEHQQTMVDGTGIHNYFLVSFDQRNNLIGVSYFNQTGTGTFRVLSQATSVLIFPRGQFDFDVADIAAFKIHHNGD